MVNEMRAAVSLLQFTFHGRVAVDCMQ